MVLQHILSDRDGLNRTKQDPSRPQIVGFHAKIDDLADGRITQQLVGNLDGDFHRGLGGALISIDLIFVPPAILVLVVVLVVIVLVVLPLNKATRFFSTIGGRAADVADPVCRFNVADRPGDLVVPDFLLPALVEPPHRPARSRSVSLPWYRILRHVTVWRRLQPPRGARLRRLADAAGNSRIRPAVRHDPDLPAPRPDACS